MSASRVARRPSRHLGAALMVMAAVTGCGGRQAAPDDAAVPADRAAGEDAPPLAPGKLDLLFMIDNSGDTDQWHQAIVRAAPTLLSGLRAAGRELDLHIGIVTSDLGAGAYTPPSCPRVGGDRGGLQNSPVGYCGDATGPKGTLLDPSERYLRVVEAPGQEPFQNFTGSVEDALACYGLVTTSGCGFEHQLASVRAALDGCGQPGGCRVAENEGFLRSDALLAIVVVTDEDDCSAPPDTELFDPSQNSLDSPLGPVSSYRCFRFGVLCQGVDPGLEPGPRQDCVPGSFDPDPRHELVSVEEHVAAFWQFKPDPRRVFVGVFAGSPEPVEVYVAATGTPELMPYRSATPGIRLFRFVSMLDADRARFWLVTDGYEGPYHPMMTEFAAMLSESLWP